MSDTFGHDASRRDALHTLTVRELETAIAAAGVVMSRRQLVRHCKSGTFDAVKLPATNNVEEWFVSPASIEKGIADIKVLQEQRHRRDATRRDVTAMTPPEIANDGDTDVVRPDATRPGTTGKEPLPEIDTTRQDTSRPVMTSDIELYHHPYVLRLEAQVDKWEGKYLEQVRRTEDIQRDHRKELIELQRMTAVGNSQTLADFMLKAKDWILGPRKEPDTEAGPTPLV